MEIAERDISQSDRLLVLLDKAYEAPFRPDSFDEMMKAAHEFYFSDEQDTSYHELKNADYEDNPTIISHLNRIERLLGERELENRSYSSNINRPSLIALLIDPETGIVEGNSLAKDFFRHKFPIHINALNLDKTSSNTLMRLSKSTLKDSHFSNEICLIRRKDSADETAYLAKCGRWINPEAPGGGSTRGLAVSIAHFEWNSNALQFCQSMFGLSDSETEVLAALLNGLSQTEIAEKRGRSVETIKAQSKSILRKSGCRKTTDLLVLATTYGMLVDPSVAITSGAKSEMPDIARPDRIFVRPDGRRISYGVYGDMSGKPVLFIHGLVQGPFFPSDMVADFTQSGIKIIAPSRPGFGKTDAPLNWKDFDHVVIDDMKLLLPELTDEPLTIVAHQGGVSHACRIADALKEQTRNMLMVGAGIPIDEKRHIAHMGVQTRIAALGVKYTPRILETMVQIGITNWLRKGLKPYLEHLYSNSPTDQDFLDDPRIYAVCEAGILHMVEQGAKALIHDGKAAMADWEADYTRLKCPIKWLHGTKDPIMRVDFVEDFVSAHGDAEIELIENGANTMHVVHSKAFHRAIKEAVFSTIR